MMGAVVEVNAAGAGRLVRAGDGPGAVRLRLSSLDRSQHRQSDQQQRVEPDDVEVEPVVQRQLQRRSAAPRRGPPPGPATSCAGRKAKSEERAAGRRRGSRCAAAPATDLAPDAERRVAAGLVGDRALVERLQAGVDRGPQHHQRRSPRRSRRRNATTAGPTTMGGHCGPSVLARRRLRRPTRGLVGQQHRGQERRGELGQGRERRHRAAGQRPGEDEQRRHQEHRDQGVVGVRLQGEGGVGVGGPAEGEGRGEAAAGRARGGCGMPSRIRKAKVARSKKTAAPWAAGRSSQLPDQGQIRSKGT